MKHTNTLLGFILVFVFTMGTFSVSAIETDAELESRITLLRNTHAELKAEVETGTLLKEEARLQWQELLEQARAEKEAFFEKKRSQIEARYEIMLENNREGAELLKEHITAMKQRHQDRVEKRAELRVQIESGEINRQEANKIRVDFIQAQQQDFQELKTNLREKRQVFQNEIARENNQNNARGETRTKVEINSNQTGAAIQIDAHTDGSENVIQFDPLGINALRVFPQVKNDLEQNTRNYNSLQNNETTTDSQ